MAKQSKLIKASNTILIGSRSTGKTTYLRALAYSSYINKENPRFKVLTDRTDGDTRILIDTAKNYILGKKAARQTKIQDGTADKRYIFTIECYVSGKNKETINLITRDYPGEIMDYIGDPNHEGRQYLNTCLDDPNNNFLFLVDKWERGDDLRYSDMITEFIDLANSRRRDGIRDVKLAVAMSKCDRGELWTSRIDPETDIFEKRLKIMTTIMKTSGILPKNLEFFAISTFGTLKDQPHPNREDEIKMPRTDLQEEDRISIIQKEAEWEPYGMIAPLYWLASGKRLNTND